MLRVGGASLSPPKKTRGHTHIGINKVGHRYSESCPGRVVTPCRRCGLGHIEECYNQASASYRFLLWTVPTVLPTRSPTCTWPCGAFISSAKKAAAVAGMLSIRCSTTPSALLALQRFRARQGPERPMHLHAVAVEDESAVIFDARYLWLHARVEGYAPDQVAGACLGDRRRRAGQYARHWGEALQEILLQAGRTCHAVTTSRAWIQGLPWRCLACPTWSEAPGLIMHVAPIAMPEHCPMLACGLLEIVWNYYGATRQSLVWPTLIWGVVGAVAAAG